MGKGGGSQTTQTIQKADPWEGIQPALRELYAGALSNYQGAGPQYYPISTLYPQSNITQLGQGLQLSRALEGNPLLGQAQQEAYNTLGGNYFFNPASAGLLGLANQNFLSSSPGMQKLQDIGGGSMLNQNPYVDAMFNQAAEQVGQQFRKGVMPGITSMFEGVGRFGSNQMLEGLGQAEQQFGNTLNRLATDIYGQNYGLERGFQQQALGQLGQFGLAGQGLQQQALGELGTQFGRERALQQNALGLAPGLSQADYADIGQILGLGLQQEAYDQQRLNEDINRYNYYQNLPNQELQFLNQILQGGISLGGQSGTTTGPGGYSNPLLGGLGMLAMGNSLFGGGLASGIGALTGGLPGSIAAPMASLFGGGDALGTMISLMAL